MPLKRDVKQEDSGSAVDKLRLETGSGQKEYQDRSSTVYLPGKAPRKSAPNFPHPPPLPKDLKQEQMEQEQEKMEQVQMLKQHPERPPLDQCIRNGPSSTGLPCGGPEASEAT